MYRAIQKTMIAIALAALLFFGGYSLGTNMLLLPDNTPSENTVTVLPEATGHEPTAQPYTKNVAYRPESESESVTAYQQSDESLNSAVANYTLKRQGEMLYIYDDTSKVVTQFSIPEGLDSAAMEALNSGLTFNTLEDIECWFESFDA